MSIIESFPKGNNNSNNNINVNNCSFTPIGTVIAVMGNSAPANYLICDGTEYSILDYPELANYFNIQFGSKNKFGGDGTTTFCVPDLRGEFLRGTGTNSHTLGGSGSSVGIHQEPTKHKRWCMGGSASNSFIIYSDSNDNSATWINNSSNEDAITYSVRSKSITASSWSSNTSNNGRFTSRPTNTAVLWCIASKDIYINPALIFNIGETVIGSYFDKPLYQRSIYIENDTLPASGSAYYNNLTTNQNIKLVNAFGTFDYYWSSKYFTNRIGQLFYNDAMNSIMAYSTVYQTTDNNYIKLKITQGLTSLNTVPLSNVKVTLQYYKTTD